MTLCTLFEGEESEEPSKGWQITKWVSLRSSFSWWSCFQYFPFLWKQLYTHGLLCKADLELGWSCSLWLALTGAMFHKYKHIYHLTFHATQANEDFCCPVCAPIHVPPPPPSWSSLWLARLTGRWCKTTSMPTEGHVSSNLQWLYFSSCCSGVCWRRGQYKLTSLLCGYM